MKAGLFFDINRIACYPTFWRVATQDQNRRVKWGINGKLILVPLVRVPVR